MLTDCDCRKIAECFCEALKSDTELQDVMARAMLRASKQKETLIKLSDAAKILGISKSLMYHIKDHFSHVKTGQSKTCHLLFNEAKLISEYQTYLATKN